jgi:serine/threonine-protein kinase HipA
MVTKPVDVAEFHVWGRRIGAVAWDAQTELATFQYNPEFFASNIQVAPLTMPLRPGQFQFPTLNKDTYYGLPGLLADSLPGPTGKSPCRAGDLLTCRPSTGKPAGWRALGAA